jgi:hypothetical protein
MGCGVSKRFLGWGNCEKMSEKDERKNRDLEED